MTPVVDPSRPATGVIPFLVTSLPLRKVQAFSIETAGTFDLDAEHDLWFSGLGVVRFEFKGSADKGTIGQLVATYVL